MGLLSALVLRVAINAGALWIANRLWDSVSIHGWEAYLIGALVLGIANAIIKPILALLTLPLIIVTLGIALFFINILMLYITDWLVSGFKITHFGAAFWATIVIWGVNWILQIIFDVDDRTGRKRKAARG